MRKAGKWAFVRFLFGDFAVTVCFSDFAIIKPIRTGKEKVRMVELRGGIAPGDTKQRDRKTTESEELIWTGKNKQSA